MKNFSLILIFLAVFTLKGFAQITESDWQKVVVTRNNDDVKGLKRAGDVNAETKNIYGKQAQLREEATEIIKKQAAKLGASMVLVQVDNFATTPINNVTMIGVAYYQNNDGETLNETNDLAKEAVKETDWKQVIVTRNKDDVSGRTILGDVSAESSKTFGNQSKLREETTLKIKIEAAKLGASIVLIHIDNFATTPINNVNMVGVAYK
jgi:hypothetical protein